MLQFITTQNIKYTILEQMQMAIEGGCKWIVVGYDSADDAALRDASGEFLALCREAGVILTFENRPELARDLGVHGVLLTDKTLHAAKLREDLGPEAIIGVECDNVPAIAALKRADIDYVQLPQMPLDSIGEIVNQARETAIETPIVAFGNFATDDVPALMQRGVSGIAVGDSIVQTDDPVEQTAALIKALTENCNSARR